MEAEDLVEDKENFAAPPTGAMNELQDVGNEDELEGQVSNRNTPTLPDFESQQTLNYLHGKK